MTTFTDINGIATAQIIVGEGQPVLALHGWGVNSTLIAPLAQRLAPLGYRVYAPDLPGFGRSAPPPSAWSVHEYVDFLLAYMDFHALGNAYLFGHSFGGRLGLVLGADHSQRFMKMALADSAGVRSRPSLRTRTRLGAYKVVRDGLYKVGMKGLADNLREWYSNRYGSADYKSASGVMREVFVKVVNEDLLPYATRVKVPTLLFWGDQDADTPLWQGRLLEKTIPDAGLVIHAGAGHYSYLDKLAETVRVIDYFFRQ
jgi:pimeloyl-ACP methyl ester carboxylesterase